MPQRRRLSAVAVSAILAFSALPLFAGAVAATDVSNEAEFRAAWANPLETLITLTASVTFACDGDDVPAIRDSATAIVVDGAGFTLAAPVPCNYSGVGGDGTLIQSGTGAVTLRNLTLVGSADSDDGLNTVGAAVVEAGSAVTGHGGDGVDAQLDATIIGSTVSGNDNNGVESEANVGVSGDSTIAANGEYGIDAEGNVTVSDSTIDDNADSGIQAGGNVTIGASMIDDNGNGDAGDGDGINAGGTVSVTGPSSISDNDDRGIAADGAVTVDNATISDNGEINESGGEGILSIQGAVTVTNSTITGNDEEGIRSAGDASVTDSTVSDNSDDSDGVDAGGDATILRSTINGNGNDGGNGVTAAANAEVTDSTISANASAGVEVDGTATITNSTITDQNTGVDAGDSVFASHATITGNNTNIRNPSELTIHLFGTVVLLGEDGFVNCVGEVDDQGFNFVDDDSCGTIAPNAANPQLGALADNGGPTFTRLPATGSPLIDAIPDADCEETTEQRGINSRPQGAGCDIGSVEAVVPLPTVSIADAPGVLEGNTGTTVEASFVVTLSKTWTRTVTVAYATANGSATAPADFLAESGTVTFLPGDVTETVTITVVGDPLDEPNETFVVNLSAPVEATLADAQGTGTILDDDGPPALSINDVSVTEGNSGFVNATFTVRLLPAATGTVTVAYATANGTATAPADYESAAGTLTFAAGDTEETVTVRVAGDTLDEVNETFVVNLSAPSGATISDSQGTGTILDDDAAAGQLPDTSTLRSPLESWGAGALTMIAGLSAVTLIAARRRAVRAG